MLKNKIIKSITLILLISSLTACNNSEKVVVDNMFENKKETEEKNDMNKEVKFGNSNPYRVLERNDMDYKKTIFKLTVDAIVNGLRVYDYQQDIPTTKALQEEVANIIGDDIDKNDMNLLKVELVSSSQFISSMYFNFLDAKLLHQQGNLKGNYLDYALDISDKMVEDIFKKMDDTYAPYKESHKDVIKDLFKMLDKETENVGFYDGNYEYENKYEVLRKSLNIMGSPYYDDIKKAEQDAIKNE